MTSVSAQLLDAPEHCIGTFGCLHGENSPVLDHRRLTHVERTDCVKQRQSLFNVGLLRAIGAQRPDRPFRHQDFRRNLVRSDYPEPVLLENRRHTPQQMIVAAPKHPPYFRQ